jgi:hypothetical protein
VLLIYICWVVRIVKYFILLIYLIILCYSWTHILFKCADFSSRVLVGRDFRGVSNQNSHTLLSFGLDLISIDVLIHHVFVANIS